MDALHEAPPRAVERPRVATMGTVLASVAVAMYFAGLIGTYLALRAEALAAGEVWLEGVTIPLSPPNMIMVTLALSCVPMQWALYAVARNDRVNTYVALGLTLLLGAAVVNSHYWLYQQMALVVGDSLPAVLIYTISGSFLALLAAAVAYLVVVSFRTLGGQYGPHQHDAVTGVTVFWYVMVAVYAVIWIAVYITK